MSFLSFFWSKRVPICMISNIWTGFAYYGLIQTSYIYSIHWSLSIPILIFALITNPLGFILSIILLFEYVNKGFNLLISKFGGPFK